MKKTGFLLLLVLFSCQKENEQVLPNSGTDNEVLRLVNEYRTKGCKCGNTAMPPVNCSSC